MISFANFICVLLTYLIESWVSLVCSYEFNLVYVQREKSQYCYVLQKHMKFTLSRTKIKKIIIKKRFCLSIYHLHLVICYNRNTRLRHSTWRERHGLTIHSKYIIGPAPKQPPVFFNKSCSEKFYIIYRKMPLLESLFNKEL